MRVVVNADIDWLLLLLLLVGSVQMHRCMALHAESSSELSGDTSGMSVARRGMRGCVEFILFSRHTAASSPQRTRYLIHSSGCCMYEAAASTYSTSSSIPS